MYIAINECQTVPGICKNGGQCTDEEMGYSCACTDQYTGENCTTEGTSQAQYAKLELPVL